MCSWTGLSSHSWRSIFTKRFNRINATKLERYHPNWDCAFNAFKMRIVIKAVQICIITAFSLVPMNDFICSNCLMSRKKISTCHLLLYNSPMVLGDQLNWFVMSSMTWLFSSSQRDTHLNWPGYLLLDDSFFKQIISPFIICWCASWKI